MRIRTATTTDIPGIARLIQKLAEHDGIAAPPLARLTETLHTLLDSGDSAYIVAEDDGASPQFPRGRDEVNLDCGSPAAAFLASPSTGDSPVIGTMQLAFRLTTWKAALYVYLEDFFVEEAYRGQGIGSAMLDLAKQIARERGCVRMDLDVLEKSGEARRFYARRGFVDQQRRYLRLVL